jgi:hypothetical protein
MARHTTPTDDQVTAWKEWVAERPQGIKDMITEHQFDPWTLYRLKSTNQRVYMVSLYEGGTVKVGVSGEFNLVTHERDVFGIDPADLEECDLPSDDERLGSLELPLDELKLLMATGMPPGYMEHAALTRTLKTYPRDWPKKADAQEGRVTT